MNSSHQSKSGLSKIEQEAVVLLAAVELIRSMVNREMFDVGDSDDTNILFRTQTHHRFFSIALVDFLSATDERGPIPKSPYLRKITQISTQPSFDSEGSVSELRLATERFKHWLEEEITVDVWLPLLNQQFSLRPTRHCIHKISGNLSKHNFLRSIGVLEEIKSLFSSAGHTIETSEIIPSLEQIYEQFHENIGLYHTSIIAEFLNDILWGIQIYLEPEFQRSWTPDLIEPLRYSYQYPTELKDPLARACYWELMNRVRSGPIFHRFKISNSFKQRY
ncbi:hypothetical protein ACA097_06875 [Pseudomonas sp. QL9]|uniref:hypothetical protein n=1 Tax=Pseudomonas sp. QL9 TaxID=3242725 RepID=UPI00352A93EE